MDDADASNPDIVEAVDPDAAFSVLSDDTRIEILRALWDAEDREATFSELRETVGMRDSGQFNYHLGTFDGQFVAETDDGYRLTTAGLHLVGALLAGAYTKTADVGTVAMDEQCPGCGTPMEFTYDEGLATVDCDGCDRISRFWVPPGAFANYDIDDLPRVAARYSRRFFRSSRDGFCPLCDGRVTARVVSIAETADVTPDADTPDWLETVPACLFDCERCGDIVTGDLGMVLVEHPAVVSFHYERGVDVAETPMWRFSVMDPDRARLESEEPVRASVTYIEDGDELTVTVDDSLSVVETAIVTEAAE